MASWIKFDISNNIIKYYDKNHKHGGNDPHMHIIDLRNLRVGDLDKWHEIREAAAHRALTLDEQKQLYKWSQY